MRRWISASTACRAESRAARREAWWGRSSAACPKRRRRPRRGRSGPGSPFSEPAPKYTTDNAAMIAAAGYVAFRRGERADMALNAEPHLALG